jgi:hypothetical protein
MMCDGWSERERVVYAVERQDHVIHLSVSAHIVPWVFELIRENLLAPVAVRLCGRRLRVRVMGGRCKRFGHPPCFSGETCLSPSHHTCPIRTTSDAATWLDLLRVHQYESVHFDNPHVSSTPKRASSVQPPPSNQVRLSARATRGII